MTQANRIEKQVILAAPISRVWRAISNADEFGQWFGVRLDGPFVPGQTVTGTFDEGFDESVIRDFETQLGLAPSKVKVPTGAMVFCTVERVDPEHYFSFRWIPYAIDADVDPDTEPTTLVEFKLSEVAEGTRLVIVESGFDQVPVHRRERAFRMNEAGWREQAANLARYVAGV